MTTSPDSSAPQSDVAAENPLTTKRRDLVSRIGGSKKNTLGALAAGSVLAAGLTGGARPVLQVLDEKAPGAVAAVAGVDPEKYGDMRDRTEAALARMGGPEGMANYLKAVEARGHAERIRQEQEFAQTDQSPTP